MLGTPLPLGILYFPQFLRTSKNQDGTHLEAAQSTSALQLLFVWHRKNYKGLRTVCLNALRALRMWALASSDFLSMHRVLNF